MFTPLLISLTLAQGTATPTLTPEEVGRGTALEKYEGKRVGFRGRLAAVRGDKKEYVYEVRATFYDQGAASRDQSPTREVSVAVCFARDLPRLRANLKSAERAGENLLIVVEGKVVRRTEGWRLEEAALKNWDRVPRGK